MEYIITSPSKLDMLMLWLLPQLEEDYNELASSNITRHCLTSMWLLPRERMSSLGMDQSCRSHWCCGNFILSQPWSSQLWRQWIAAATIWDGSDYCLSICHVTCRAHIEPVRCMWIVEGFCVDWYGCEVWACHIDFCIIFESVNLFC